MYCNQLSEVEREERSRLYTENLARERAERKAKELDNLAKVKALAVLFGGNVEPPRSEEDYETYGYHNYFSITLGTDKGINLNFDRYNKNRVTVSGQYPKDQSRDGAASITMADTKTAEQMHKDINRRFMPEYEVAHAQAVVRFKANNDYKGRVQATKDKLLLIDGVTDLAWRENGLYIRRGNVSGEVEYITGDGTCTIKLNSITPAMLAVLLNEVQP